jgi:hypothetical protein
MTPTIEVELPDEVLKLLGTPAAAAERARKLLILDLFRHAEISEATAARLLGISRWDMLDVITQYQIPVGPQTSEEVDEEVDAARARQQNPLYRAGD